MSDTDLTRIRVERVADRIRIALDRLRLSPEIELAVVAFDVLSGAYAVESTLDEHETLRLLRGLMKDIKDYPLPDEMH